MSYLKKLLGNRVVYQLYQWLVGANRYSRLFANNYINYQYGQKLLDIGCGPATILRFLPEHTDYTGIDSSHNYISFATKKYPDKRFINSDIDDLKIEEKDNLFDTAFCIGVLHHLSDVQARKLLSFASASLKESGVFLSLEPVLTGHQGRLERWFMNNDRGKFIRTPGEYKELTKSVFTDCTYELLPGTMNIPFTIIIMKAGF